jgi:agmatinase
MGEYFDERSNFLRLADEHSKPESSKIAILPLPFEASVSFGEGTASGPESIIDFSQYVEFFDEEFERDIAHEVGIVTCKPLKLSRKHVKRSLGLINDEAASLIAKGFKLLSFGGEHTVTLPLIEAHLRQYPNLSVIQIDAHSDLRDEYQEDRYSHACVMARVAAIMDPAKILQIGIRAQCREERAFIKENGVKTIFAHDIRQGKLSTLLEDFLSSLSGEVYLTFDIDGLDVSLMPATGTPEPGGLSWHEAMEILNVIRSSKKVIGADLVEYAPLKGMHASGMVAAKLAYKLAALLA